MNIEKSGLKNDNNEMEFQHAFFVKERSDLLELIKRKVSLFQLFIVISNFFRLPLQKGFVKCFKYLLILKY